MRMIDDDEVGLEEKPEEVGLEEKPEYTRYINRLHQNPNHCECEQTKQLAYNIHQQEASRPDSSAV